MWNWTSELVSLAVGATGVMDIISALWPPAMSRYQLLREILPLDVLHASRTLTLIVGICLVVLSANLLGRKHRAWLTSIVLLIGTLILHMIKGLDVEEFLLTCGAIAILVVSRQLFYVKSDRLAVFSALKTTAIILAFLFMYMVGGYWFMRTQFVGPYNLRTIPAKYAYESFGVGRDTLRAETQWARWFEGSINAIGIFAVALVATALFAPAFDHTTPTAEDRERMQKIVEQYGHDETDYFSLMSDKVWWFSKNGQSAVAYKRVQNRLIVLGMPIGIDVRAAALEFRDMARRQGLSVVWYNVEESATKHVPGKAVKVGESAVIPIPSYTLEGSRMADVRHAITHSQREGVYFAWYSMVGLPWKELHDIDELYQEWTARKHAPELTFSLGFYPFPSIVNGKVLISHDRSGVLTSVVSLFPVNGSGYVIDLMMRRSSSPNGVMEATINEAVQYGKRNGWDTLHLGMAPLADVDKIRTEAQIMRRLRGLIFERFNRLYDYKSLYNFKNKFNPQWSPRFIIVDDYIGLPADAAHVVAAHVKKKGKS